MINLRSEKLEGGIYYLSCPDDFKAKEDLYLKLRAKEERIYSDNEVKILPFLNRQNKHYKEWQLRNITAQKLVRYFSSSSFFDVLDIGAGNCWLSNLISSKTENSVCALDLNEYELKQGTRVFSENKRLKFIYGNIFDDNFNGYKFDVILYSSSIQYFPDFSKTIERSLFLLHPNGSIIITDSKFYNEDELRHAKERTKLYYNKLGFPEAADNYFHHTYSDLNKFNVEILRDDSLLNKILVKTGIKKTSPFPFIKIYKQ